MARKLDVARVFLFRFACFDTFLYCFENIKSMAGIGARFKVPEEIDAVRRSRGREASNRRRYAQVRKGLFCIVHFVKRRHISMNYQR